MGAVVPVARQSKGRLGVRASLRLARAATGGARGRRRCAARTPPLRFELLEEQLLPAAVARHRSEGERRVEGSQRR